MEPVDVVYSLLTEKKKIVITTHQKPDGDAMGASLGLYHFLKNLGHAVSVISPTNWATFLNWMPSCFKVFDFEKLPEECGQLIKHADIIFGLDFNTMHRTKNMKQILIDADCTKVLIDHHELPQTELFNFGISDISKSSTCELVYTFIQKSPFADKLDRDTAICLYTGIMTDTGSFRFASTTPEVHKIVAHLMEFGINHSAIYDNIFDNFTETRLRFIGNTLLNHLDVFYEYNTALMAIPKRDIMKFEIKTGDTEGLVNYLLTIEGIKFGALLIDRIEECKWSFRSKGDFDVNVFARTHFEGGGHKNASGGRSDESLDANIQKFKQILKQYENQLQ